MLDASSPTAFPPPFDTIARMRREGRTESEIAATLGLAPHVMQRMKNRWAAEHPDTPLPPTNNSLARERNRLVARMFEQGMTQDEIASKLGVTRHIVANAKLRARRNGLLAPKPVIGHRARWNSLRRSQAVPPRGFVSETLDALDPVVMERLLRRIDRKDRTLAMTIARILTEALGEPKA